MMDFKTLHPLVTFIYFVMAAVFSMAGHNPVIVAISALAAFLYNVMLKKNIRFVIAVIPIMLFVALLNPVFSHKGATILFYLGNPITLESILYGVCAAFMLFAVLMWFGAFNIIMTSDKIMYIFGKIMPKASLIISMTLRLVPRLKNQLKTILECQKMVGRDINEGGIIYKIKVSGKALYSLMGWLLESSLVTSDVMQARGYGNKGRSNYTIYSFTRRDKSVLFMVLALSAFVIYGFIGEKLRFEFYPLIYCESISKSIFYYFCFFVFAFFPVVYDCCEVAKWKSLKSKI